MYLTLQAITHTGENRLVPPGEIVDLGHLAERVRRNLCLQGVVADLSEILRVNGIGVERARVLGILRIITLQGLIEADPEDLEARTDFTSKQVRAWQEHARQLLEQPALQAEE